ncbi:hypothetical protein EWM64_g4048 [Hericium alpestre]|uniref:DUF7330 domain-containing protein n=1 Tax=Hericium alpestre TaxID=135208 RepID=A0A4Z0A2N4_9AGAM|nr:hypothetical protein EWM64_g4048 [Hericium alpestre]
MIITEEQGKRETDLAGNAPNRHADARAEQDHPPPYSPGANGTTTAASTPSLPATNYVHVNRQYAPVRGQYLIDLRVPPLPADAGAPAGPSNVHEPRDKPNLLLEASQANVGVEHDHASSLSPRPFLTVVVRADHKSAQLTLPRSFHGKLILYTVYGRITMSEELQKVTAVLWEAGGTQMCFVGDRPAKWKSTLTNDGDEVYSESEIGEGDDVDEAWVGAQYGAVSVRFEGEREPLGVLDSVRRILTLGS